MSEKLTAPSRFPNAVSQLLSHGCLPWMDSQFFVALDKQDPGGLFVGLADDFDLQKVPKFAQTAAASPFNVSLAVF